MASWLENNLVGIGEIVAGGVASVYGAPEFGVPLMGAGAATMGQNATNATNVQIANNANATSQAEAIQQEQYQTQMSNTAYQRQAADMKAAGINPIMAGVQGGASSPSGAMGSVQSAHVDNALGVGLSSGADVSRTISAIKQAGAAERAQASQATLNLALGAKATQDTVTSASSARQYNAASAALEAQQNALSAEAGLRTKTAVDASQNFFTDKLAERLGRYSNSAKSFTNLVSPLRGPQSESDSGDNNPWFNDKGYNINGDPVPY